MREKNFQGLEISRFIACFQFKANKNKDNQKCLGLRSRLSRGDE